MASSVGPRDDVPMYGETQEDSDELLRMREQMRTYGDQAMEGRGVQSDALGQYGDILAGEGPSVAQGQQFAGQQATLGSMMQNRAMGNERQAMMMGAQQGQDVAAQGAVSRAQEQAQAAAAQGGLATQMRGQDLQGQMGFDQLQQQATLGQMSNEVDYTLGMEGISLEDKWANAKMWEQIAAGIGSGIGGGASAIGSMSDVRAKQDIQPLSASMTPEQTREAELDERIRQLEAEIARRRRQ